MYQVIKDYWDNSVLRHSFNELASETFSIDFEDWYQNGFWGEHYNPHSIVIDNRVVANVSVNVTDFLFEGNIMHFLQLGTVMTEKSYRNRGLIRRIINEIEHNYKDKVDGIYLFGNDNVLDFYPNFGFQKSKEYLYEKELNNTGKCQLEKVIMDNPEAWHRLEQAMQNNSFHGKFDMIGNPKLIMFYVTKYMQDSVYYHKDSDTFIIAEVENDTLFIHNIFSCSLDTVDAVTKLFGEDLKKVTLGFTPQDTETYTVREFHEDDCTFFIRGEQLQIMEEHKLRIPSLAHA